MDTALWLARNFCCLPDPPPIPRGQTLFRTPAITRQSVLESRVSRLEEDICCSIAPTYLCLPAVLLCKSERRREEICRCAPDSICALEPFGTCAGAQLTGNIDHCNSSTNHVKPRIKKRFIFVCLLWTKMWNSLLLIAIKECKYQTSFKCSLKSPTGGC